MGPSSTEIPSHEGTLTASQRKEERKRLNEFKLACDEIARVINGRDPDPNIDLSALTNLSPHDFHNPIAQSMSAAALFQFVNVQKKGIAWNWKAAERLARLAEHHPPASPARMLFGYVFATQALHRVITAENIGNGAVSDFQRVQQQLHHALSDAYERFPADGVYTLAHAKVASLSTRDEAKQMFSAALSEAPEFMDEWGFDRGAHTYFSADEVPSSVYPETNEIDIIHKLVKPDPRSHTSIAWSVDERFFRGYAPYWLHLAPYLTARGYRLVFLVAGPRETTHQLLEQSESLLHAITTFHGLPKESGRIVHFIPISIPNCTTNPTTYYASARFLFAETLLEATSKPVLTIDADMILTSPLEPMLKALTGDFACPVSRGFSLLSPWRRYMAGAAFFNTTPTSRQLLQHVKDYIMLGLPVIRSWMLDQNALTYGVEMTAKTHEIHFQNLGEMKRPFQPDGNARMIELPRSAYQRGQTQATPE